MKIIVKAPKDTYNTPPEVDNILIDPETELIEWHKTFIENDKWKVTNYTIIKKEIYND